MVSLKYKKALHGQTAKAVKKSSSAKNLDLESDSTKSPKTRKQKNAAKAEIDVDYVMQNDKEIMRIFEKETLAKANQVDTRNQIRMKE